MSQYPLRINLASEPFRRDRPIFIASVVVSGVLTILLIALSWMAFMQHGQASDTREAIAQIEQEIQKLDQDQAKVNAILRNPANAEVLDRTVFLNYLLQRKGLSWTKIFGDLETVLPYNVRIISVRPQIDGSNNVQLDLYVGSASVEPVVDMLMKMENSPLFGKTSIANSQPPSQTEPLYRYRLTVNYAQKI